MGRVPLLSVVLALASAVPPAAAQAVPPPAAAAPAGRDGGDGIDASLTGAPGDPARGRAIVVDRQRGLCLLCHTGPFPEQRFQGTLAPSLAGTGSRLTPARIRLRIVDSRRVNPDTIMPPYHDTAGLTRVARSFEGRPILDAGEVEDVVAFLATLRDPEGDRKP